MQKVITYIDGFNLYFGLCAAGLRKYLWLNVQQLTLNLLKPGQLLVCTKYFTSRVSDTPTDTQKSKRQGVYIEALQTLPDVHLFFGHYLKKQARCRQCHAVWQTYEEKMTDVNIAVEMMTDAHINAFDVALIVSGDSDLAGPVQAIRRLYQDKRVVIAFPPKRHSLRLREEADASFVIGRKQFKISQFPNAVLKEDGHILNKPLSWT